MTVEQVVSVVSAFQFLLGTLKTQMDMTFTPSMNSGFNSF